MKKIIITLALISITFGIQAQTRLVLYNANDSVIAFNRLQTITTEIKIKGIWKDNITSNYSVLIYNKGKTICAIPIIKGYSQFFSKEEINNSISSDSLNLLSTLDSIRYCGSDIKRQNMLITNYITSHPFNTLNKRDKRTACYYLAVSDSIILILDTSKKHLAYLYKNYNKQAVIARQARFDNTITYLEINLPTSQAFDLANSLEMSTSYGVSIKNNYLTYGIESVANDGISGIIDFVMGTGSFVTTGFPSKPYFNKTLQNGVINILQFGIY